MAEAIEFMVEHPARKGINDEPMTLPFVSLADPDYHIEHLQDADDIVIDKASIRVAVSYPLSKGVPIQSDGTRERSSIVHQGWPRESHLYTVSVHLRR